MRYRFKLVKPCKTYVLQIPSLQCHQTWRDGKSTIYDIYGFSHPETSIEAWDLSQLVISLIIQGYLHHQPNVHQKRFLYPNQIFLPWGPGALGPWGPGAQACFGLQHRLQRFDEENLQPCCPSPWTDKRRGGPGFVSLMCRW